MSVPLYDGGSFRLYGNRIEKDKGLFFKSTEVTYYDDVVSARLAGRTLTITRTGWKPSIMLDFRRKEHARVALDIINLCKS
ncbi:hypothetical protein [Bifidobacterium simiarum]|uniref:hypothetical protein n=1 Tax=Bifidobacterium simiarum TaxID=2045441 RepID=UPI001BDC67E8|nr:hypothetical protein [Bifidobacterium simiarum]MBT1166567.1 hypothetical protein [Bifidobacterium simiarum]